MIGLQLAIGFEWRTEPTLLAIFYCRYQSASNPINGNEGAWGEVLSRVAKELDTFFD